MTQAALIFLVATPLALSGILMLGMLGWALKLLRGMNNRMSLILRVFYQFSKESAGRESMIEDIISSNNSAFAHQKKAFEHHKILISSLNRQLSNLEAALSDGRRINSAKSTSSAVPFVHRVKKPAKDVKPASSPQHSSTNGTSEVQSADTGLPRNGAVLLDRLLAEKKTMRRPGGSVQTGKVAKLSAIFDVEPVETRQATFQQSDLDERKVANG